MEKSKEKNRVNRYLRNNLFTKRILKFSTVGFSGLLVNMGLLYILSDYFHIYYVISSIAAIETSIISNFFLNDLWTWSDREKKSFFRRLTQYHISVGMTAILVNWLLLIFFTEVLGIYYLISNMIGIAAGTLLNFIINDIWTFKARGAN
jgi:dolichol-phosphate mannosyltransferase